MSFPTTPVFYSFAITLYRGYANLSNLCAMESIHIGILNLGPMNIFVDESF